MDGETQLSILWINTDRVSRQAETQIRAQPDRNLVAEYAKAMLGGAVFPPIIVFQDDKNFLHIGDGYHRVDAAALAHAKNPERPNEILAELRKGSFEDALRYAMQANNAHGKRLELADYGRAIQIALRHRLIEVERASEVVPALTALIPGLSARYARQCTSEYRADLIAKRDRLITALDRQGKTQEQIADQLQVPQRTVSDVLARLSGNGADAESAKPPVPPVTEAAKQRGEKSKPAALNSAPKIQLDFKPLLPLLDDDIPDEDDSETGIVAGIVELPIADAADALRALERIHTAIDGLFGDLDDLKALEGKLSFSAVQPVHLKLLKAVEFLTSLAAYIHKRGLQNAS